ncbi:hypothetical protein HDU93_007663 [Gonapodya sp. JEL0774]|nr:hypothetical protein HDU93_007663 [Gonapodya sp. JEL0774]
MLPALRNAREQEHTSIKCSTVLPASLAGVECFFVGPGTFTIPYHVQGALESETKDFTFDSLFDCLPLLSRVGFDVSTNSVSFSSKLTAQTLRKKIFESHGYPVGYMGPGVYGTDPNQSALARTIFALAKTKKAKPDGLQYVNPNTLEPVAWETYSSINPAFAGTMSSAKPAVDPKTGETFTVVYTPGVWSTTYNIVSFSSHVEQDPGGDLVCRVTGPGSIVHSLALTPNFVVLALFPFNRVMAIQDSVLNMFKFDKLRVTVFHVIHRKSKQHVGTFRAPSVYSLSIVNAFEDKDTIHVDMTTYENDAIHNSLRSSPYAPPPPSGTLSRFSLNDAARGQGPPPSEVSSPFAGSTKLVYNLELPTINPRYRTRKNRFVYGCSVMGKNRWWTRIVKIDLDHPESPAAVWSQSQHFPSTLLFVPDPSGDSREDQGHIITYIYSSLQSKSYLLVLNSEKLQEVARVELPQVVPLGFAGAAYARRTSKAPVTSKDAAVPSPAAISTPGHSTLPLSRHSSPMPTRAHPQAGATRQPLPRASSTAGGLASPPTGAATTADEMHLEANLDSTSNSVEIKEESPKGDAKSDS